MNTDLRETLSALAHEQWSGWMRYLFEKSKHNPDGTITIPKWAVDRWMCQMNTNYNNLSESEKESDQVEADKFMNVFNNYQPILSLEHWEALYNLASTLETITLTFDNIPLSWNQIVRDGFTALSKLEIPKVPHPFNESPQKP